VLYIGAEGITRETDPGTPLAAVLLNTYFVWCGEVPKLLDIRAFLSRAHYEFFYCRPKTLSMPF